MSAHDVQTKLTCYVMDSPKTIWRLGFSSCYWTSPAYPILEDFRGRLWVRKLICCWEGPELAGGPRIPRKHHDGPRRFHRTIWLDRGGQLLGGHFLGARLRFVLCSPRVTRRLRQVTVMSDLQWMGFLQKLVPVEDVLMVLLHFAISLSLSLSLFLSICSSIRMKSAGKKKSRTTKKNHRKRDVKVLG